MLGFRSCATPRGTSRRGTLYIVALKFGVFFFLLVPTRGSLSSTQLCRRLTSERPCTRNNSNATPRRRGAITFCNLAAGPRSITPAPVAPSQELFDPLARLFNQTPHVSAGLQPIAQRAYRCCRGMSGGSGIGVVNIAVVVVVVVVVFVVVFVVVVVAVVVVVVEENETKNTRAKKCNKSSWNGTKTDKQTQKDATTRRNKLPLSLSCGCPLSSCHVPRRLWTTVVHC